MKDIRILLLGDEGTGKTSIIQTVVGKQFRKVHQNKIPPVCIPPDMFVQYKDITTLLIDSDADTADEEIEKASVILLVYDVTIDETKHRLEQFWLPKISKINEEVPVILVGSKVDMRPSHFTNDLETVITPIIMKYKQVEMGIECSAKAYLKLVDVLFCAQRAVLFPIAPLQDPITKELKPEFEKALLRIFRICDSDFDGFLNDDEINDLQVNVFNGRLESCHVNGLKEFLRQECDNDKYSREDMFKGINFEAFKTLQTIFIKKMKLQTCWLILEYYGYNEKLRINDELLINADIKEAEINENWQGLELSDSATEYLDKLFEKYQTAEGSLSPQGIEEIFEPSIDGCPWDINSEARVQHNECIDRRTWKGLWQKSFNDDYEKAFETLLYLGYCEQFYETVNIQKERELLNEVNKEVFLVYIVGKEAVGKTSLLEAFLKQEPSVDPEPTMSNKSVVASVEINNKSKYLVLTEFYTPELSETLFHNSKKMNYCDVMCLIHDGTESSLRFIQDTQHKLPKDVPKVLIRTKTDKASVAGSTPTEEIANELKTSQYIEISNKNIESVKAAIDMISATAILPIKGLEHSVVEELKEKQALKSTNKQKVVIGGFILTAAVTAALYVSAKPVWGYLRRFLAN